MIENIEKVESGKYPRDVRDALNKCIDLLNRPIVVKFTEQVLQPTVQDGSNQLIIYIPVQSKTDCDGNTFYVVAVDQIQ